MVSRLIWDQEAVGSNPAIPMLHGQKSVIILQEVIIVIRPTEPIYSELISGALSMKVVSNKYLLKNDE